MGLIYNESFVSPQYPVGDGTTRFGGFEGTNEGVWFEDHYPYTEVNGGAFEKYTTNIDDAKEYESGKMSGPNYVDSFFEKSKIVTYGCWFDGYDGLEISFHHCHPGGSNKHENFRVKLSLDDLNQKGEFSFIVAQGESHEDEYPHIPSETVYFDYTQPIWLWVQCDMSENTHGGWPEGPKGVCKIWLNDQLVVVKEDIHTGDELGWLDDWDAEHNNFVRVNPVGHLDILGLIALNETYGIMVDGLGNVDIATLPPQSGTENWDPYYQGEEIDEEVNGSTILAENRFIDLSELGQLRNVRAKGNDVRDLLNHDQPFLSHIHNLRAVSQIITHKKQYLPSDDSNIRVEPSYALSGRDPESDRSRGQISKNQLAKVIQIHHTIPYSFDPHGEYEPWDVEFYQNSAWGYKYNWPVHFRRVEDGFDIEDFAYRYFEQYSYDTFGFQEIPELLLNTPNEAPLFDGLSAGDEATTEMVWNNALERWKQFIDMTAPGISVKIGKTVDEDREDLLNADDWTRIQKGTPDEEFAWEEFEMSDEAEYKYRTGIGESISFGVPDITYTTSIA